MIRHTENMVLAQVMDPFKKLVSATIVVAVALLIFVNSFFVVAPTEGATIQQLGIVQPTSVEPGPHWKVPFLQNFTRYEVGIRKHEITVTSKTRDLQPVAATFVLNIGIDRQALPDIRKQLGGLGDLDSRIVIPQTQEAFNQAAAAYSAEEVITKRTQLKADFDSMVTTRLQPYGIIVRDAAVSNLAFSDQFDKAVEDKQVAEQQAQQAAYVAQRAEQEALAVINRAKGDAEAQRLEAEALKAVGGELVLKARAIEKWDGHFPQVMGGEGALPFINITPNS